MNDRINDSNGSEIDDILSDFSTRNGAGESDGELASLAGKYGVDVSGLLDEEPAWAPPPRTPVKDPGVPEGHRVVYEEKSAPVGGADRGKGGERRDYKLDGHGMRIVYDADPVEPAEGGAGLGDFVSVIEDGGWESLSDQPDAGGRPKNAKKDTPVRGFLKSVIPWAGDGIGEIFRKTVMLASVVTLICSVPVFGRSFIENARQKSIPKPEEVTTDARGNVEDPRLQYPDIEFPEGLLPQFVSMYAQNQDFAGYLWVNGINRQLMTPVVGCHDNKKYLETDFLGKSSRYGTPFLDMQNNIDTLDHNTTIHGHNMKDTLLFSILEDYMSVDGFKADPIITYATRYRVYKFKIYAVIITNEAADEDNGYVFYYNKPGYKNEASFESYLSVLDQKKLYTTGVDINYDDTLLSLSTCYDNVYKTARLVVVGRMLREGESEDVDMSKVKVNENPRYPQAWYDKKGQSNPFKDAERWNNNDF